MWFINETGDKNEVEQEAIKEVIFFFLAQSSKSSFSIHVLKFFSFFTFAGTEAQGNFIEGFFLNSIITI